MIVVLGADGSDLKAHFCARLAARTRGSVVSVAALLNRLVERVPEAPGAKLVTTKFDLALRNSFTRVSAGH